MSEWVCVLEGTFWIVGLINHIVPVCVFLHVGRHVNVFGFVFR